MRRPFGVALISTAAALPLLAAPAASAQEPGVHIDPGAPAEREYAIPFAEARRDAGSGTGSSADSGPGGSAAAVPAFGQGISRVPTRAGGTGGSGAASRAGSARRGGLGGSPGVAGAQAFNRTATAVPNNGIPSSLWLIGLAVLVAGLAGGLIARRLSADRSR